MHTMLQGLDDRKEVAKRESLDFNYGVAVVERKGVGMGVSFFII